MRFLRVGWSMMVGRVLALTRSRARRLRLLDVAPFESALGTGEGEHDHLVAQASVADLQELLASGALTSEALTLLMIGRARRLDGSLGSLIELNPEALAEARAADERRHSGQVLGPLDGIPVTVKDNIETAGPLRTTAGAMVLADHVADRDAPVVAALRRAGAVLVAKANLSELAGAVVQRPGVSAVGGPTRNPYGAAFSPGGSSSGSAVSVAAGLCAVSVGTETSGSLLAPAAFNGVVGMKPSRGLVDTQGIVPLVRAQDSAGPIGRHVSDVALLLAAIATAPIDVGSLSAEALRAVPVGVLQADILSQRSRLEDTSDNEAMLARILDGLAVAGATVTETSLVTDQAFAQLEAGFTKVVLGGLAWDTVGYLAAARAPVADIGDLHAFNLRRPRARMPQGQFLVDLAYLVHAGEDAYHASSEDHCRRAAEILDATFDASGTEVLVSIANRHSTLYATAGYPAVTVPLGLRANGMPTGVTLIGRHGDDERLLARAFAFEQATQLRVEPPAGRPS